MSARAGLMVFSWFEDNLAGSINGVRKAGHTVIRDECEGMHARRFVF
jgi:hypothetical protein